MSIEWKNDWARWRARDSDGELWEYELKPQAGFNNWVPAKEPGQSASVSLGAFCPQWRDTLEARPVKAGDTEADASVWIAWHGGDMPVDGDTLVDFRLRDGKEVLATPAKKLRWHYNAAALLALKDIVKYRLAQPAPETQSEPAANGTLTGAALYRAIADAIDAGESPRAFQVDRRGYGFETAWSWGQLVVNDDLNHPIRRKPNMRSATLPSGETVEWPAPMTSEPSRDQFVFRAEPGERNSISFRFNPTSNLHQRLLRARVLYADSESAERHGIAVAKLNGGDVTDED